MIKNSSSLFYVFKKKMSFFSNYGVDGAGGLGFRANTPEALLTQLE